MTPVAPVTPLMLQGDIPVIPVGPVGPFPPFSLFFFFSSSIYHTVKPIPKPTIIKKPSKIKIIIPAFIFFI